MLGTLRPILLGARCTIGAGAVLHGGTQLATAVRVEEYALVGCPEYGYAVRHIYPGAGEPIIVGDDVVLRAGAVIYAGVTIGAHSLVGAGSVVTHDIPAHATAYGVPARIRATRGAP